MVGPNFAKSLVKTDTKLSSLTCNYYFVILFTLHTLDIFAHSAILWFMMYHAADQNSLNYRISKAVVM